MRIAAQPNWPRITQNGAKKSCFRKSNNLSMSPTLDVQDLENLFEAFDRIASRSWPALVSDESGKSEVGYRICNETVVQFLGVVDLLAARDAGDMDVADPVEIVAQVA